MFEKEIEIWGKPLEKMTTPDLKELAKAIPDLTGVHGMKKEELIAALRQSKGIEVKTARGAGETVRALKHKIKALKVKRAEALAAQDRRAATLARKRIARLKKKTRK